MISDTSKLGSLLRGLGYVVYCIEKILEMFSPWSKCISCFQKYDIITSA